jgi:hypothetical protein
MTATHTSAWRELAHRAGGGIDVSLLWRARDDRLLVVVANGGGLLLRFAVPAPDALDAYYHPFVYAPAYTTGTAVQR